MTVPFPTHLMAQLTTMENWCLLVGTGVVGCGFWRWQPDRTALWHLPGSIRKSTSNNEGRGILLIMLMWLICCRLEHPVCVFAEMVSNDLSMDGENCVNSLGEETRWRPMPSTDLQPLLAGCIMNHLKTFMVFKFSESGGALLPAFDFYFLCSWTQHLIGCKIFWMIYISFDVDQVFSSN